MIRFDNRKNPTSVQFGDEMLEIKYLYEGQILRLIKEDLASDRLGRDSMLLIERFLSYRNDFILSLQGNLILLDLEKVYGHPVMDILGVLSRNRIRDTAYEIARFNKETNGDYSIPTLDEIRNVVRQMVANKRKKPIFGQTKNNTEESKVNTGVEEPKKENASSTVERPTPILGGDEVEEDAPFLLMWDELANSDDFGPRL